MPQLVVSVPVYVIASIALPLGVWMACNLAERRVDVFLLGCLYAYRTVDAGVRRCDSKMVLQSVGAQGKERVVTKKCKNVAKPGRSGGDSVRYQLALGVPNPAVVPRC
jgi:hypothetical protein